MSKLGNALGSKYQENKLSILTRTFILGDHTFKVRVPSTGEIDAIFAYYNAPKEDDVERIYKELTEALQKSKDSKAEGVEFTDDDVIVEGRSMRETAKTKAGVQHGIVEYMKFLIPETGQSLDDLTYADVEEDFPFTVQLQLLDKIRETISTDYKETRQK
jgi:hypothetical protein